MLLLISVYYVDSIVISPDVECAKCHWNYFQCHNFAFFVFCVIAK